VSCSEFQDFAIESLACPQHLFNRRRIAYLIRHDPEFRGVRHEHCRGRARVRLKPAIPALLTSWARDRWEQLFVLRHIRAPREIVASALAGIVPPEHITVPNWISTSNG